MCKLQKNGSANCMFSSYRERKASTMRVSHCFYMTLNTPTMRERERGGGGMAKQNFLNIKLKFRDMQENCYFAIMADWLPDKWQVEIAIGKDGSKSEYYRHKETGQTFPTVGDMLRYVNYLRNEEPDVPNFKKHFMNDDGTIFVERPWEKDTKHTMHDYIHGRVGKCKGMTPESSFATATNAETREKLEQKIKGKAPESSFSLANVG